MREMKDSGIEWIVKIPATWNEVPIRFVFKECTTKNVLLQEKMALKFTYGSITPKQDFDADTDEYIANTIANYTVVHPGVIMINGLNLNYDFVSKRVGLVKDNGAITSAYLAIEPTDKVIPEYATYQLKSWDAVKAFHNMGTGVRKTLDFSELGKKRFVMPPLAEQQRIASFLDSQCSEIDAISADIQKEIETLEKYKRSVITEAVTKGLNPDVETKDSGAEWIGRVPNNWNLGRIGGFYSLRNEKVSDKDYPPLSVTMKGILPQLETAAKTNDGDNRKLVRKGDFAINSRSDRRGSCGISKYDGSVSLINTVLTPRGEMSAAYYDWVFHCTRFSDEFYRQGHGIVDDLWTTGWQEMKKIIIPVPPLPEQNRIADYLSSKCSDVDFIISQKNQQVETLANYKKTLIYEYVTGKKEVPIQN